ncbi:MBG domain-containing protein [Fimbriiglobus ruber]|uniref:MBG domain-containing protein n=1 Tax=Fimbriiglobus ruber TaxID=1908690 RepID=UPI003B845B95
MPASWSRSWTFPSSAALSYARVVRLTTTATSTSNVGSHTITVAAGTLSASNYAFTVANDTLTVVQATTFVKADSQEMSVDATALPPC